MRNRFRRGFRRFGEKCLGIKTGNPADCPCPVKDKLPELVSLDVCPENSICLIQCNPIKKTKEIGLNPGKTITIFKNEPSDPNIIIGVESTRYILAKSIAKEVLVLIQ